MKNKSIFILFPILLFLLIACKGNPSNAMEYNCFQRINDVFYNNLILENRYLLIWDGFKMTCYISLLSILIGTVLSVFICLMNMNRRKWMRFLARSYVDLLKAIPQVVLLLIMFYIIFAQYDVNNVLIASITFALSFSAYVSEIFKNSIENIDKGQKEAGIALGFNKIQIFCYIILPQALKQIFPLYKGEIISLVKLTAIVGYIAIQDITKTADIIRSRTFDAFFPFIVVTILYFLLAWILTKIISLIEMKFVFKLNKGKK